MDSPGLTLHDQLWCKAALSHLKDLWEKLETDVHISIGPCVSRNPTSFLGSLASVVEPCHGGADIPGGEFMITEQTTVVPQRPRLTPANFDQGMGRLLLFKILKFQAVAMDLPAGAKKLAAHQLVVTVFPPQHRVHSTLYVSSVSGVVEPMVLNASMLSMDDFLSLRIWSVAKGAERYDFSFPVAEKMQPAFQKVVRSLVEASARKTLLDVDSQDTASLDVLLLLASHGCSEQVLATDVGSRWRLTLAGTSCLRSLTCLEHPTKWLCMEVGDDPLTMSAWQLVVSLQKQEWVCSVYDPASVKRELKKVQRRKAKIESATRAEEVGLQPSTAIVPTTHKPGTEKRWWIDNRQVQLNVAYMQCLLLAERRGFEVQHRQVNRYYAALLDGKPLQPRRARAFAIRE